jgi:hypothetical protein
MKLRRVFVTLEIETDATVAWLRRRDTWSCKDMRNGTVRHCIQAQVNVAKIAASKAVRRKARAATLARRDQERGAAIAWSAARPMNSE